MSKQRASRSRRGTAMVDKARARENVMKFSDFKKKYWGELSREGWKVRSTKLGWIEYISPTKDMVLKDMQDVIDFVKKKRYDTPAAPVRIFCSLIFTHSQKKKNS